MALSLTLNPIINQKSQEKADEFIKISQKELVSSSNLDEKLRRAAKSGFFYLEMPEDCKILIGQTLGYANSFYTKNDVKKLKLEGFSGYHDRENYQVESLYLERKYWNDQLPVEIGELALKMYSLAIDVLKKTVSICEISTDDQEKVSGGVSEGKGDIYFTFNHYRDWKSYEGLPPHRDFGQITVLFINKLGLEAKMNGEWVEVPPLENHFVVNFGRALESSINNPDQLTAAWHRVCKMTEDRISFGVFADNANNSTMYQRTSTNELSNTGILFSEYIQKSFAEHY